MSKYHKNLWKMDPGAQQKTMPKNIPQQIEKCSKNDSQIVFIKWVYFRGFASWGTCGGPNHFLTLKVSPQRSQSASNDRKLTQKWYQRAPRLRKRAPKDNQKTISNVHLLGDLAWRTARSAFNNEKRLTTADRKNTMHWKPSEKIAMILIRECTVVKSRLGARVFFCFEMKWNSNKLRLST